MKNGLLKAAAPHALVLLSFLVIIFLFYRPVFSGQELQQHDILQGFGSLQELKEYRDQNGEEGLWAASMFSGMPAYLINVEYSGDLIKYVRIVSALFLPRVPGITFLMLASFYILMVSFRVRPWLGFIGALGFAFSSFAIISLAAGHNFKVEALAYLPLLLAGLQLSLNKKLWLGGALFSLALAFQIRTMHFQIIYYSAIVCGLFLAACLLRKLIEGELGSVVKPLGIIALGMLLALGAGIGKLWSTLEYNPYSNRSASELAQLNNPEPTGEEAADEESADPDKEYAFRWSWGIFESFTLFNPGLYGGASADLLSELPDTESARAAARYRQNPQQYNQARRMTSAYWGAQPGTAPFYAGAVFILLFVLGLFFAPVEHRVWVSLALVFFLMLAWGHNLKWFNYMMFDYFPAYSKFRAVTMAFGTLAFLIPFLGILGLERYLSKREEKQSSVLMLAAVGTTLLLGIILLITGSSLDFMNPNEANYPKALLDAIVADRKDIYFSDGFRSLLFVALAGAVLFVSKFKWLKVQYALAALSLLCLIDVLGVSGRFLTEANYTKRYFSSAFRPTAADQVVLGANDPHARVLKWGNPWNDAVTSYLHRSIGGYHGSKLRRYQDFIDLALTPELQEIAATLQGGSIDFSGIDGINMLDTRYILFGTNKEDVIVNPAAFGPAWYVNNVEQVNSPDEELEATTTYPLRNTAVVDVSQFPLSLTTFGTGTVELVKADLKKMEYRSNATEAGLIVFSEIYYPKGWTATIDGQPADILRANFVLRALEVPAGAHEIVFEFKPQPYYTGNIIMLICSLLIIAGLGTAITRDARASMAN